LFDDSGSVYVVDKAVVWLADFGANAMLCFDPKTEQFGVARMRGERLVLLVLVVLPMFTACNFLRGYATGRSEALSAFKQQAVPDLAQFRFLYDDLNALNTDTLETNALPWKIVVAALLLDHGITADPVKDRDAVNRILQQYGFLIPQGVGNWSPANPKPTFEKPMGLVTGFVERSVPAIRLEVANIGCATCHAGVMYDASGLPTREVWLGLPNTSINVEAYTQAVYQALKKAVRRPDDLITVLDRVYPTIDPVERRTITRYVLPRMRERMAQIEKTIDRPTPFSNGGPGLTNGVAALKLQLGTIPSDRPADEYGFTSIPDLGSVLLRSSLLYDGVYAPPGGNRFEPRTSRDSTPAHTSAIAHITTFFTVPTMGVKPNVAGTSVQRVEEIFRFVSGYRPPAFPGRIDPALAGRGRILYHRHCAECHGTYSEGRTDISLDWFPNRFSRGSEIGTDPARYEAIDTALIAAIEGSDFGKKAITARHTGGYVAPRLSGLWATAPYLHNGSVPTLWHLMNPSQRPAQFYVGGHRLDFNKVGIDGSVDATGTLRYPDDYHPWSTPVRYDTRSAGYSNRGHEKEFESVAEPELQRALLEYLKLL